MVDGYGKLSPPPSEAANCWKADAFNNQQDLLISLAELLPKLPAAFFRIASGVLDFANCDRFAYLSFARNGELFIAFAFSFLPIVKLSVLRFQKFFWVTLLLSRIIY